MRKLNGKKTVLRLSVRACPVISCRCMAVVLPLIREGQRWVEDCTRSNIVLVPLLSLGQHVLASPGTGVQQHSLAMSAALKAAGGAMLSGAVLHAAMFSSAVMTAVSIDMMEMKVSELKEELEARGKGRTGNKAWLRRALHAAIVEEHIKNDDT